jgi:hypothetical protein
MRIKIDENVVEFRPESETEQKDLESLWNLLVDCIRYNRKLVPMGEYISVKDNVAQFSVEEQFIQ